MAFNWADVSDNEDNWDEFIKSYLDKNGTLINSEEESEDIRLIAETKSMKDEDLVVSKWKEMNNICGKNTMEVFTNLIEAYPDLNRAQEKENAKEPKKDDIPWVQKFVYFSEEELTKKDMMYVDKPTFLSKINYPYRSLSNDIIKMIYGKKYPEKWSKKARLDLYNAREFISKNNMSEMKSSQNDIVEFYNYLMSLNIASVEYGVYWDFAKRLEEKESIQMMKDFVGQRKIKDQENELSKDTQLRMWSLSLIDAINYKIKLAHSMAKNNKHKESSHEFRENKRIIVTAQRSGSSNVTIEIMQSRERESNNIIINMFISSQLCILKYNNKEIIGTGDMFNYLTTIIDHALNLALIRDYTENQKEKELINYVISLLNESTSERVELCALYESTCLLMSDLMNSSSRLPILDNILESVKVSPKKTEELISILKDCQPDVMIKMSCIGKTLVYAEVREDKGLQRYTQRTNRNHEVSEARINRLRSLFRMKCITNYVRKYGRVPNLTLCPDSLSMQLEIMAAKGDYDKTTVNNTSFYQHVRLGKMLEVGQEANLSSRVIDKACSKSNYDPMGNSVKELIYYITHDHKPENFSKFNFDKEKRDHDRVMFVTDRYDPILRDHDEDLLVRLVEKEKELKESARFYGVASFNLKIYVSTIMELVKRAMKLMPGQMMTMTEDERRDIMHKMSRLLEERDAYSIFLDYSGHNTSQRPENNLFILEEIADMYGFKEGSIERKQIVDVVYVFSNMTILFENSWSDLVYSSKYQNGAIEGWLGPLWGIQSQLMMDDMLKTLGFRKYIGTTYSDDSCGVFIEENLTDYKLDQIITYIQDYGYSMGLLVKLSQTQVTNGRCSMLKNHYYKGKAIENTYKRIMSISAYSSSFWGDDIEQTKSIDSGFTSSCVRSNHHKLQVLIRNFKLMTIISQEVRKFATVFEIEWDPRYINSMNENRMLALARLEELKDNEDIRSNRLLPYEYRDNIKFFLFNQNNDEFLRCTLALFYLPYTIFGYALTSIPDAIISGYSISNVKRISYCSTLLTSAQKKELSRYIKFSNNAGAYLSSPFPMIGGRYDTGTLIKDNLKNKLKKYVLNRDMLRVFDQVEMLDYEQFQAELITTFKRCFSARITSKYVECSVFNFMDETISKIDNSSTIGMLLGKKQLSNLWNKAWNSNHNLIYKARETTTKEITQDLFEFDSLIKKRNDTEKIYKINNEEKLVRLNFITIEEIPFAGKIKSSILKSHIQPVSRSFDKRPDEIVSEFNPTKTHINIAKFDRDLEIEGMFQNKLVFNAYEICRYTKWLIMELEKYSECEQETYDSLVKICDVVLNTFSDAKFEDLEPYIVAPRGGRYFHRADSAGFNPKTGDLSDNALTTKFDITGIEDLIAESGGSDNNLNINYLIVLIRVNLAYIKAKGRELKPLYISPDILDQVKDVTFSLKEMKSAEKIYMVNETGIYLNDLIKIKDKGKLYRNYSSFITYTDSVKGKFINHADITSEEKFDEEDAYHSVNIYMEDQMIISPEQIPENILFKLAPCIKERFRTKQCFFLNFYNYYKSLNIIGNETPNRSVIRSLLFEEIYNNGKDGRTWISDIMEMGYSENYRTMLLRVFIIATSLCYRLEQSDENRDEKKIIVNKNITIANSIRNLARIRKGNVHFCMSDKRITNLILNGFPTLGYKNWELREEAKILSDLIDGRTFSQLIMNQYFLKEHHDYLPSEEIDTKHTFIQYDSFTISKEELKDKKAVIAALKGFETICALNCKPCHVSSPTRSDVFPSISSLLKILKSEHFLEGRVLDLFGGRGDAHVAMESLKIEHTSISRNDGYNIISRAIGMIEKKRLWDATKRENYMPYFDRDIILLDISHYTGTKTSFNTLICDCLLFKKKIIMRLNTTMKLLEEETLKALKEKEIKIYVPSIESPGIVYLTIDDKTFEGTSKFDTKGKEGFSSSVILEKLTSEIYYTKRCSLFGQNIEDVRDHTEEAISDEELANIIINQSKLPKDTKDEDITKSIDLFDFMTAIPDNMGKDEEIFLNNKIEEGKIKIYNPRKVIDEESGISSLSDLKLELRKSNTEDMQIIECKKYLLSIFPRGFIIDFNNINFSEFSMLSNIVLKSDLIDGHTLELWRKVKTMIEKDENIHLNQVLDMVNMERTNNVPRCIGRLRKLAHKAVYFYRKNRIVEGLMIISGFSRFSMRELMKHKSKATRYDILDYKLLINRIRKLFMLYNLKPISIDESKMNKNINFNGLERVTNCTEIEFNEDDNPLLNMLIKTMRDDENMEKEMGWEKEEKTKAITNLGAGLLEMSEENREVNMNVNMEKLFDQGLLDEDDYIIEDELWD